MLGAVEGVSDAPDRAATGRVRLALHADELSTVWAELRGKTEFSVRMSIDCASKC